MSGSLLSLLFVLSIFSCKGPATKDDPSKGDTTQKITLLVDGHPKTTDPAPIISCGYTGAHLVLGYLSDKDDIQLSISAYMADLKGGSYQVYECTSAAECNEQVPDNNQIVLFGPYPKDPMPPMNLFRTGYFAPSLGLNPLTFVVTSITDEQQQGNPFKTKRIKGQFSGSLAYIEKQQGSDDWHIVGKTTRINGSFDVFCSIR